MSSKLLSMALCALAICCALSACADDSSDDGGAGASGQSGDGDGDGDCADVPSYADVAAFDKCNMCHSSELSGAARRLAPTDHNFDTYEGAAEFSDKIGEEAEGGDMPPANSGITLTADERAELVLWATCGAPE